MSEATAHATGKRRRRMSGTGWLTLYATDKIQELVNDIVHIGNILNHAGTCCFTNFTWKHFHSKPKSGKRCS